MDVLRGLYVGVLSLIILLSGCIGSGVFDNADGDGNTGNTNLSPLIEVESMGAVEGTPTYSSSTGELIGYSAFNASVYRAVKDLDGNISSSGWDFDLDGQIDQNSTGFRVFENLSIPSPHWVNASTISGHSLDYVVGGVGYFVSDYILENHGINEFGDYQIATIAFIATDNDGATSAELLTINNLGFHLSVGTGGPPIASSTHYRADDAADDASAAGEGKDTLMRLQMTGSNDLSWSFVRIALSVGDSVYTCSVAAGDDCSISQQAGDNDNAWEPGEYIFLSEGTEEICSAAGCAVDISVTNNGNTVAGDGAAVVN